MKRLIPSEHRFVIFLSLVILVAPLYAGDVTDPFYKQRGSYETEFEYDESLAEKWKEIQFEIPKLPDDENLVEGPLDKPPPGLKLYLDPTSISLSEKDRVLRYWVVLKSEGGGYNAIYEGMRCNTEEYKVYAYGHPSRKPQIRPASKPKWKSLFEAKRSDYHPMLAEEVLCAGITPKTLEEVNNTLKGRYKFHKPFADSFDI